MLISFEASTLRRSAGGRSSMRAPSRCRSKPPDQVEPVHHFPGRNPDERFALLEKELAKGPAAHGWEDQRRTLERVRTLIGRQFKVSCSIAGVWRLLHRHGWSWQSPARRSLERDEHAVEL
ncbi:winged helix-turn-helix domain-containing protein [Streptomyces scabiei]|uniref:helix-turn-helix domain-containing protein n=1 Tax=Streptomyces griseiscabiei TaxID=2993540 RepID=UPI0011814C68|nr:winged helix-turn-helix domain-containing protein [Streptomyces griseiscabiei]